MKMCDRCRVPGCLLDYNGKACANARKEYCLDVVFTNADHIRSMTDEELAEWLENVDCFNCECCVHQMACRFEHDAETVYYEDKYDCRVGRMEWLKQPYKEGT